MLRRIARPTACLALIGGLAVSASASARAFYVIQSGTDGWTVMDPAGIEPVVLSVRRAWTVRVQRNIMADGAPQPGYVRTLTEYDCDREQTRWREFSAFSRSGALLAGNINPSPEWTPASQAPDIAAAFRVVCRNAGAPVVSADNVAKVVVGLMAAWDPPAEAERK